VGYEYVLAMKFALAMDQYGASAPHSSLGQPLVHIAREIAQAYIMLLVHPKAGLYNALHALVREAVLASSDTELVRSPRAHRGASGGGLTGLLLSSPPRSRARRARRPPPSAL
jgi:hypothetical protein